MVNNSTSDNSESHQLQQSEDRYHKMIDEVQEYAIILLDENGIIQNWNKGAQNIKQYKESEAVGKHFEMFYLPEDRATHLPQKLMEIAKTTGKAIHEGWRIRKDGTRFWGSITLTALHDKKNEVIGYSKVTRDLTEKKIAEEKLQKLAEELRHRNETLRISEQRYHKMIAEVQDYAIILLSPEGVIQNWNAGAKKIKGYSADEIVGKNFREFYLPEDRTNKLPEQLIGEAIAHGKATHEGWRLRKDGTKFWGSIVLTALHNDEGEIIGFSKVTRDLTERKIAEDKMKEYLIELEKRNKELEQFAYVASHDLQEPLRKIQTFTDMVERNLDNPLYVKKYFDKINRSAYRMAELIRSVLNYSRLTNLSEEKVDTDLDVILKNVIVDFELLIQEKGAKISSDPLPVIKANPFQVNQLFFNLISNALKFSDKDPIIHIGFEVRKANEIPDLPPLITFADQYAEISVRDNGIGFDQQYESVIFSMFQRLHGRHEYAGTGIGLAICQKIMENHQGFIRAEGTEGKGATFYLYFPL